MNRREFLVRATAASVMGLAYGVRAAAAPVTRCDMHSHVGASRLDLRDAMTRNGMLLVARTLSADRPVTRNEPGKGIRAIRDPQPGELAASFEERFKVLREENVKRRLTEITSAATLDKLRGGGEPGVVLACEGADFLEGDMKRLESYRAQGLTHVQLVHYRVSDVGDISTEMPVHNGLTAFGKDVVRACNRLGMLVDVAHCTHESMAQALEISTKPIVYSHGHVISSAPHWTNGVTRARAISTDMAKRIAERGGVIGLWTPIRQYPSIDAYAAALADTAGLLGADHVGVGTDMAGIPGGSVVPSYGDFAQIGGALSRRGVSSADIEKILGGNYLRVLAQALAV